MTKNSLLLFTIFSLFVIYAFPVPSDSSDGDEGMQDFVLDQGEGSMHPYGRYLDEKQTIKNDAVCDESSSKNICNGVSANNGKAKLQCCKKRCRNILGDENNCGACENKCKFVERCCEGKCIRVMEDANRCGHCDKKCKPGVQCKEGDCAKSGEL